MTERPTTFTHAAPATFKLNPWHGDGGEVPIPDIGWADAVVTYTQWTPAARGGGVADVRFKLLSGPESGCVVSEYICCSAQEYRRPVRWDDVEKYAYALGVDAEAVGNINGVLSACVGKYARIYVAGYTRNPDFPMVVHTIEAIEAVTPAQVERMRAAHEKQSGVSYAAHAPSLRNVARSLPTVRQFDWGATDYQEPREWLYGKLLLRGELSVLVGDGGTGKSTFFIASALAMASGRPLLGLAPTAPCTVWLMSFEEDESELRRRVYAAMRAHGLTPEDVKPRLIITGKEYHLCLATGGSGSVTVNDDAVVHLTREIALHGIDAVFVDPLAETHRANEQDNTAMQAVAKTWVNIATKAECGIFISHHTRKTGGEQVTVDDMRGAVALKDTARVAVELNPMTKKQADGFGLPSPHGYFSLRNGKANFTARSDHRDWFEIVGQVVPQGENPFGEIVGVVKAWQPPAMRFGVTAEQLAAIGAEIGKGECRKDPQAKNYVGHVVAHIIGADVEDKQAMAGLKVLINRWLKDGALVVVQKADAKRELKAHVALGNWSAAAPTTSD